MHVANEEPAVPYGAGAEPVSAAIDTDSADLDLVTSGEVELLAMVLGGGRTTPESLTRAATVLADKSLELIARGDRAASADGALAAAAVELGRRALLAAERQRRMISGPVEVASWARAQLGGLPHEEIWTLCLDARHRLICAKRVALGGGSSCGTTARDILRAVIRTGASAFVLVHNHPSGDPTPSPDDVKMTKAVVSAAEVVGLPLLDHVVVGGGRHASLYELGALS